jgi:protein-S-isoprenylcysteine O-methyltransferase Ste14
MRPLPFTNAICGVVFWSAYVLWIGVEVICGQAKSAGRKTRKDRGSYALLKLCLWVGLTSDFILAFAWPQQAILRHRNSAFWVGIGLMVGGMFFRMYAMRVLGRFFTYQVATHAGQTVVEIGPYRYIRHPSYAGGLVTLVGIGLALGNWAGLDALMGCMLIAYGYRMFVEERVLIDALGDPYREYMTRTKRLVPFVF